MNDHINLALDGLVSELAAELGEVSSSVEGEVTSYSRDDVAFARASSLAIDVRLPQDIAEAALRTADSATITGERGWIRFTPSGLDPHVLDRAQAWFRTAWRHAGDG